MNTLRFFPVALLAITLSACASKSYPALDKQNPTATDMQGPEARSMYLTDREKRNITTLEDHFYEGNFGGVIQTVATNKETKTGSLDYLNETLKLKAFSECLEQSVERCAESFRQILHNQPDFELDEAELTHPIWGPIFQAEKEKMVNAKLNEAVGAVNSMNAHFIKPAPSKSSKEGKQEESSSHQQDCVAHPGVC